MSKWFMVVKFGVDDVAVMELACDEWMNVSAALQHDCSETGDLAD